MASGRSLGQNADTVGTWDGVAEPAVPTAAADSDEAGECRKHKSCRARLGHNRSGELDQQLAEPHGSWLRKDVEENRDGPVLLPRGRPAL